MPSRRHPIHVPYLVDRLRTVPPKDLADAADADSLNQSFNSIMSELHRYLRYLQDADDAGLPAGAFAGTPTDLEVGATAILGDPELGWIGGGHTHGIPSGSPVGLGAALSDGVLPTFSRSDHVHKYDILGRLAGADIGVHGAINWLDTASIDFTVASDVGNDELEISAVVLAAGIDHGGLAGLGDDDHLQYLLLAGRAGGQTAFGGTAAGNILELQGADNSPDVGRLTINSPITLTYDVASNTTPAEPYVFRWNPTASYGAFIGGFLTIAPDMTATATTFIPATFSDNSIIRHAANPAFAAFTFINELAVIQNLGNFNLMQGLVINVAMTHARITSGTSTTPQTIGMNFAPQTRASISGAVMTRTTGITAINVAPTFSTVSGATVNLGTIRGMLFAQPVVALFQPQTGVENMTAYYGIDFPDMTFGGASRVISVVRSALAAATNTRFLDHTGTAQSRLGGQLLFPADLTGITMGASGDFQFGWAAGNFQFWQAPTVTSAVQLRWTPTARAWQFSGASSVGFQFNADAIVFGTTNADPTGLNNFVQFAAPNLRAPAVGGEYADVLWTAGGSIAISGFAISNLDAFKINAVAYTLGGGSVTDVSTLHVAAQSSDGIATRSHALRVQGRTRVDGLMNHNESTLATLTADVAALALPPNNLGRFVLLQDADASGPWTIQGIVNTQVGDSVYFINNGANAWDFGHEDGAAAAADRIITPTAATWTLGAREFAKLWYDPVATRWRILESNGA